MNRIRYFVALCVAKLAIIALKVFGYKGTDFPGIVAFRICPGFLRYAKKPKTIIGVTGTNGKDKLQQTLFQTVSYSRHRSYNK